MSSFLQMLQQHVGEHSHGEVPIAEQLRRIGQLRELSTKDNDTLVLLCAEAHKRLEEAGSLVDACEAVMKDRLNGRDMAEMRNWCDRKEKELGVNDGSSRLVQ